MALHFDPLLTAVLAAIRPVHFELSAAGLTDIGRTRRRNEDSVVLVEEAGVAVVADGMGGHPGGDTASRTAADAAADYLVRQLPLTGVADADEAAASLAQHTEAAVMAAHRAIRRRGQDEPDLEGMGTTLTVCAADRATGAYAVGHVGDSRAYRLRDGELLQLTRDDTWVQERVDAEEFTEEQARRHPFSHILTQCLGLEEEPEPQVITGQVEDGDLYLLCTDGLMGMVEAEELPALLAREGDETLERLAQRLVDTANERGGLDNITVLLVSVTTG